MFQCSSENISISQQNFKCINLYIYWGKFLRSGAVRRFARLLFRNRNICEILILPLQNKHLRVPTHYNIAVPVLTFKNIDRRCPKCTR